jgi:hypothetical protein
MRHYAIRTIPEANEFMFTCIDFKNLTFSVEMPKCVYNQIEKVIGVKLETYAETDKTIRVKKRKDGDCIVTFDEQTENLEITLINGYQIDYMVEITDENRDDFNMGLI